MNANEEDVDLVGLLERSVGEVHLDRGPEGIVSRGRSLNRRKRTVPALATVGILAVSLGLAATTQHGGQIRQAEQARQTPATRSSGLNVQNAAYAVHTDAKTGEVTVTLASLADPSALQDALKNAGIPLALVVNDSPNVDCRWVGAKQVPFPDGVVSTPTADANGHLANVATITFNPAKMLEGEVLAAIETEVHGEIGATSISVLSNWPTGCAAYKKGH